MCLSVHLLQSTLRDKDSWFLPSQLLSWLGVGSAADKVSVLVGACTGDVAWFTYVSLKAAEMTQPDMSLELWTELQAEMITNSTATVEHALAVCIPKIVLNIFYILDLPSVL